MCSLIFNLIKSVLDFFCSSNKHNGFENVFFFLPIWLGASILFLLFNILPLIKILGCLKAMKKEAHNHLSHFVHNTTRASPMVVSPSNEASEGINFCNFCFPRRPCMGFILFQILVPSVIFTRRC